MELMIFYENREKKKRNKHTVWRSNKSTEKGREEQENGSASPKNGAEQQPKETKKKKSDHKVRSKIEEIDCLHTVCFLFFFSSQRLYF